MIIWSYQDLHRTVLKTFINTENTLYNMLHSYLKGPRCPIHYEYPINKLKKIQNRVYKHFIVLDKTQLSGKTNIYYISNISKIGITRPLLSRLT